MIAIIMEIYVYATALGSLEILILDDRYDDDMCWVLEEDKIHVLEISLDDRII